MLLQASSRLVRLGARRPSIATFSGHLGGAERKNLKGPPRACKWPKPPIPSDDNLPNGCLIGIVTSDKVPTLTPQLTLVLDAKVRRRERDAVATDPQVRSPEKLHAEVRRARRRRGRDFINEHNLLRRSAAWATKYASRPAGPSAKPSTTWSRKSSKEPPTSACTAYSPKVGLFLLRVAMASHIFLLIIIIIIFGQQLNNDVVSGGAASPLVVVGE